MIRPLRHRHRQAFVGLAIVIPIVFIAGLAARRPIPSMDRLPPPLGQLPEVPAEREIPGQLGSQPAVLRLGAAPNDPGRVQATFVSDGAVGAPDMVVFWWEDPRRPAGDSVPSDAVRLGTLRDGAPTALSLPAAAGNDRGQLLVYSVAHRQWIGRFVLAGSSMGAPR